MEELKLPEDQKLAGKIVDGHIRGEQAKIDQGLIGKIFGSRNSVAENVAAIIALSSSLALIASVVWWGGSQEFSREKAVASLSSLITLTIGYLFGRLSKNG